MKMKMIFLRSKCVVGRRANAAVDGDQEEDGCHHDYD
jgi:hypothetical protein